MKCPKCGHPQANGSSICPACGIVFDKYYKYHPRAGELNSQSEVEAVIYAETESLWGKLQSLALPKEAAENSFSVAMRAFLLIVLLYWSFQLIGSTIESNAVGDFFLHLVNLPFHEAGHVVFRPFGEFMGSLGGTLGQLIMPQVAGWTLLLKTRDPFGAAVCLWWFGENLLDIAPYINDARAGELPLLGGNFGHSSPYGFHDWEYLLTETGLIGRDHALADVSFALGSAIMLLAIAWALWLVRQQWQMRR